MRRGFLIGSMNRRGTSSEPTMRAVSKSARSPGNNRMHARALQNSHPNLASTLEELAWSYENHGVREDLDAKLRIEGY